jgi:hypothetical protein
MSASVWEIVERWKVDYGVRTRRGLADEQVRQLDQQVGPLAADLCALYRVTNGVTLGSFRIFPVFDASDVKGTWDSIQRANEASTTRFLGRDEHLLTRFLVFAEVGGGDCAAIDRSDNSIWYEESDELRQTDFEIFEFIEAALKEQVVE